MAHLDLLPQLCPLEFLDSGVPKQAMLAMSFSRGENNALQTLLKVFLHYICSQCNASTLRAGPKLH